jgi:hypothetical protein
LMCIIVLFSFDFWFSWRLGSWVRATTFESTLLDSLAVHWARAIKLEPKGCFFFRGTYLKWFFRFILSRSIKKLGE